MKILFFYQYFGTPKGSWSTRIYELTRRWVQKGYEVTVVTAPYEKSDIKADAFISKQRIDGINLIVINSGDSNKFSLIKRVFRALLFSCVSVKYALTSNYDVCISSSGPITIGLPMIISKLVRRKKTIFEVRDLWPAGGIEMGLIKSKIYIAISLWFERLCYNSADAIVTASIGQKEHIINRYPAKSITVIPNASDLDLFGEIESGQIPIEFSGKKLFCHIGSLGLIHNINYWVDVAYELSKIDLDHNIDMVFIGDGKDKQDLIDKKNQLNLKNLHFLGLMKKSELPVWVRNSVATLFATLDNPVQNTCCPNKIFDSFAAAIPIIQTSTGWIGELVENEHCGINVPLDDPAKAASKMLWLSENPEEAKFLGSNSFRLANTTFNRDLLADEYLNLIRSLKMV